MYDFFINWWIQMCLRYAWIEEAEVVFHAQSSIDGFAAKQLADFFAQQENWERAMDYERMVIDAYERDGLVNSMTYDRLIVWSERAGRPKEAAFGRERAFTVHPSYQRLQACLADIEENRQASFLRECLHVLPKRSSALIAVIHWMLGEKGEAWQLFQKEWMPILDRGSDAECLLKWIEQDEPIRAVEIHTRYATIAIDGRNRASYKEAIPHFKRIRQLLNNQGKKEEWGQFIANVYRTYARLPALKDELQRAGLWQRAVCRWNA